MKSFRPNCKQTLKTYYEVPVEVMEDAGQLVEWAEQAIQSSPAVTNRAPKSRDIQKAVNRLTNTRSPCRMK